MSNPKLSRFLLGGTRRVLQVGGYRSHYVSTPLGKIHYFRAEGRGSLPPMVFLHGLGAHGAELAPVFWQLRRYARAIITIDLPVHGWSEAPHGGITPENLARMLNLAVDEILQRDPPALFFGNSLGGFAAIRYFLHRPEFVHSLVLSSPGGAHISMDELLELKRIFADATQANPQEFIHRLYNHPPFYAWLLEMEVKTRFGRSEMEQLMQQFHPDNLLQPQEIQQINVPTLLLWGKEDRILVDHLRFWREHIPAHVRLEEPAHFTHCPYMEMPTELALRIRDFARLHRDQHQAV